MDVINTIHRYHISTKKDSRSHVLLKQIPRSQRNNASPNRPSTSHPLACHPPNQTLPTLPLRRNQVRPNTPSPIPTIPIPQTNQNPLPSLQPLDHTHRPLDRNRRPCPRRLLSIAPHPPRTHNLRPLLRDVGYENARRSGVCIAGDERQSSVGSECL